MTDYTLLLGLLIAGFVVSLLALTVFSLTGAVNHAFPAASRAKTSRVDRTAKVGASVSGIIFLFTLVGVLFLVFPGGAAAV